jgi:hypothetical protein
MGGAGDKVLICNCSSRLLPLNVFVDFAVLPDHSSSLHGLVSVIPYDVCVLVGHSFTLCELVSCVLPGRFCSLLALAL